MDMIKVLPQQFKLHVKVVSRFYNSLMGMAEANVERCDWVLSKRSLRKLFWVWIPVPICAMILNNWVESMEAVVRKTLLSLDRDRHQCNDSKLNLFVYPYCCAKLLHEDWDGKDRRRLFVYCHPFFLACEISIKENMYHTTSCVDCVGMICFKFWNFWNPDDVSLTRILVNKKNESCQKSAYRRQMPSNHPLFKLTAGSNALVTRGPCFITFLQHTQGYIPYSSLEASSTYCPFLLKQKNLASSESHS